MVGPSGLEPPTSCLSGTRSNLLSYEPMWLVCSSHTWWWRWWDSNPWPPACRAGALPTELHPRFKCKMQNAKCKIFGFCFSPLFWPKESRLLCSPGQCQHWAIFPCGLPQSIFTTAELNFCVRNGYRWTLCVCSTDYFKALFLEYWTTLVSLRLLVKIVIVFS